MPLALGSLRSFSPIQTEKVTNLNKKRYISFSFLKEMLIFVGKNKKKCASDMKNACKDIKTFNFPIL